MGHLLRWDKWESSLGILFGAFYSEIYEEMSDEKVGYTALTFKEGI